MIEFNDGHSDSSPAPMPLCRYGPPLTLTGCLEAESRESLRRMGSPSGRGPKGKWADLEATTG